MLMGNIIGLRKGRTVKIIIITRNITIIIGKIENIEKIETIGIIEIIGTIEIIENIGIIEIEITIEIGIIIGKQETKTSETGRNKRKRKIGKEKDKKNGNFKGKRIEPKS